MHFLRVQEEERRKRRKKRGLQREREGESSTIL